MDSYFPCGAFCTYFLEFCFRFPSPLKSADMSSSLKEYDLISTINVPSREYSRLYVCVKPVDVPFRTSLNSVRNLISVLDPKPR